MIKNEGPRTEPWSRLVVTEGKMGTKELELNKLSESENETSPGRYERC